MQDSNREEKQLSKKEARRAAKIEAKRRKLAEQRAERNAAAAAGTGGPGELRPVTADSANRERRPKLSELTEEEQKAAAVARQSEDLTEPAERATDAAEKAETAKTSQSAAAKTSAAAEMFKKIEIKKILKKCGVILLALAKKLKGLKNLSTRDIIKYAVIFFGLIGIIYGIVEIRDYYRNKTDYYIETEGYDHAVRFDDCVPLNGIDISMHQKGKIDWYEVKTSGVDYVFLRAGYRAVDDGTLHADEKFAANYKGAKKAGLLVGAYFYSQALDAQEGREEAEFVLETVKDYDLTMPIVIDYEIYKDGRLDKRIQAGEMYAASFYHDAVLGFTNTVEAAGYESAVYASRDMLTNYMQADLLDDMAWIWLARYEKSANLDADYWFWQYTDKGRVGGIDGAVDMSFWYMQPEKVYETRAKHRKTTISIRDCRISFQRSVTKIHNFRADPKFSMTYEGKGMTEGRDYICSIVHNTQPGTGYVLIRGIGKYKDWIMYPFAIE